MLNIFKRIKSNNKHTYELIINSSHAFILHLFSIILSYIFTIIIAWKYGPEGSGIFALVFTYISIGVIISKSGIDIGSMKYISRLFKKDDNRGIKNLYLKSLFFITVLSVIYSMIFYFLSEIVSLHIFNKEYLTIPFTIGALTIFPASLMQFHAEIIRSCKMIGAYFFVKNISYLLICIILLLFNFNINLFSSSYTYLNVYLISHYITLFIAFFIWFNRTKIFSYKSKESVSTKLLFKSSTPIMFTTALVMIMGFIDIIMLGFFTTNVEVGIYNIAFKISSLTSIALIAVNSIIAPKISQLWDDKDFSSLQIIISNAAKIIFFTSLPILIIYMIFPKLILSIFGHEFILGSTALMILSIGQFCNSITGPVGQVLNMTDNENILRNTAFVSMILNISLNYYLIPLYGINGAAFSTAVSGSFWNFLCVFCVYKRINLKTYFTFNLNK